MPTSLDHLSLYFTNFVKPSPLPDCLVPLAYEFQAFVRHAGPDILTAGGPHGPTPAHDFARLGPRFLRELGRGDPAGDATNGEGLLVRLGRWLVRNRHLHLMAAQGLLGVELLPGPAEWRGAEGVLALLRTPPRRHLLREYVTTDSWNEFLHVAWGSDDKESATVEVPGDVRQYCRPDWRIVGALEPCGPVWRFTRVELVEPFSVSRPPEPPSFSMRQELV